MYKNIFLFLIAFVIVVITMYMPVTVYSQEDLSRVELGFPLPFMVQNQNISPPFFPWRTNVGSFYENPIYIIWHYFLIDIVVVFGILKFSISCFKLIRRRLY